MSPAAGDSSDAGALGLSGRTLLWAQAVSFLGFAGFNIALNFYNSWLLSEQTIKNVTIVDNTTVITETEAVGWYNGHPNIDFPCFYTTWHMLATVLGATIILTTVAKPSTGFPNFAQYKLYWWQLLAISTCSVLNILCNNASLRIVSLFLNQVIKATGPMPTMLFSFLLEFKRRGPRAVRSVALRIPHRCDTEVSRAMACSQVRLGRDHIVPVHRRRHDPCDPDGRRRQPHDVRWLTPRHHLHDRRLAQARHHGDRNEGHARATKGARRRVSMPRPRQLWECSHTAPTSSPPWFATACARGGKTRRSHDAHPHAPQLPPTVVLWYDGFISFFIMLLAALILEHEQIREYFAEGRVAATAGLILAGAIMAFLFNLSTYFFVLLTSALTSTVVANGVKVINIVISAIASHVSKVQNWLGVALVCVSLCAYAYFSYMAKGKGSQPAANPLMSDAAKGRGDAEAGKAYTEATPLQPTEGANLQCCVVS